MLPMEGPNQLEHGLHKPLSPWNPGITSLLDPNASRMTLPSFSYLNRSSKCRTCGWNGAAYEILQEHQPGASARAVCETAKNGCWKCKIMEEYWKKTGESLDWIFHDHQLIAMTRRRGTSSKMSHLYSNPCRQHMPSFDTSSRQAFEWVQEMLELCNSCHKMCSKPSRESFLPTRLLRLNPSTDSVAPDIVLIETVDLLESDAEDRRYLTLSHCWGQNFPQYTTTSATLCERKRGISNSLLPRTFQDAVMFTLRLGFKYLWIDSVCIIQDDRNDWLLESAKMHEVYASSYLTLAATSSSNSSGGLYFTAEPPRHFTTLVSKGDEFPIFMANQCYQHHISFSDHYLSAEEHRARLRTHPLLTRGWIFQERMLFPRVLHFTSTELAWECCEYTYCECGYTGLSDSRKVWFPAGREGQYIRMSLWHDQVMEYTKPHLTNDEDRLQALAGIARAVYENMRAKIIDLEYHAGLWSCDLAQNLFWFRNHELNSQPTRPNQWCAPSWSWASILGAVSYGTVTNHAALFEILNVSTDLVGPDNFGPVRGGRLHVFGHITEAKVRERSCNDERPSELSICDDSLVFTFVADIPSSYPALEHERPLDENDSQFYLLAGTIQSNLYPRLDCIVLREERNSLAQHGSTSRVFQRVGLATREKAIKFGPGNSSIDDFDESQTLSWFSSAFDFIII